MGNLCAACGHPHGNHSPNHPWACSIRGCKCLSYSVTVKRHMVSDRGIEVNPRYHCSCGWGGNTTAEELDHIKKTEEEEADE